MASRKSSLYADVILPISIDKAYTYSVPADLAEHVAPGMRVEVQFGKSRRYAAIIARLRKDAPEYETKSILSILDPEAIISEWQIAFWEWIASYYCCSIGDVMHAALPSSLKLTSETIIRLLDGVAADSLNLSDDEFIVWEALNHSEELSLDQVKKILDKPSVLSIVHSMFRKGIITVREELQDEYKPQIEKLLEWGDGFDDTQNSLTQALSLTERSEKQTRAVLAFTSIHKRNPRVLKEELQKKADVDSQTIKALEKKGILFIREQEVNRFEGAWDLANETIELSPLQDQKLAEVKAAWEEKSVVLLHGVTGSGKTWLYKKIMQEAIEEGGQVLYLIPEIALTVQIIARLQKIFGEKIVVAHSRLNNNERVDLWKAVADGVPLIIGVRSSIFLPFRNLSRVIVDEEHDSSFKQTEPAPRYHARDSIIYLATQLDAKVLLGTATPSIESYYNAREGKYGLVQLNQRYSTIRLPDMRLVDLRRDKLSPKSQFSSALHEEIKATIEDGRQVIIFRNRRGYAPILRCERCDLKATCHQCDVSLTFHKFRHTLQCHYCGIQQNVPRTCPACGSTDLLMSGYGTEKLEDELKIMFPELRIQRMDYDTTRKKNAHHQIIAAFEAQQIDILVGTQMVTKGLDFDHVGLVGVINADQQLYFPNFRAQERCYQLLTQVSGRAGRKHAPGTVVVQTFNPTHAVFADIAIGDFRSFFNREMAERKNYFYPPFSRLISVTLKHKKKQLVDDAARRMADDLKKHLGKQVIGPAEPHIGRVRNYYLMDIGIKLPQNPGLIFKVKQYLRELSKEITTTKGLTTTRINIDVDPYD